MANQLTGNPIILDTAAATVLTTKTFRVSAIKWTIDSGGADNDELVLQDKNGKVKYHDLINIVTSGQTQPGFASFPTPVIFDGLIALTISGGTVYLYLTDKNNIA